jgi:hypothetical protein
LESLWEKILEAHAMYPVVQQGGPLIFIFMMKKIQYDTKDAGHYLQEGVKKTKLTNFDGENVEPAVSLLRGADGRFRNSTSGIPVDFTKWVLDIFQTASVEAFNSQFALYTGMFSLGRKVATARFIQPTPNELYQLAEQTYLELVATDSWTGVTTKGTQHPAGLTAGSGTPPKRSPICWNCGEVGHSVPTCSKPKGRKHIAEAKAKMKKDQKNGGSKNKNVPNKSKSGKPSKWAPQTNEEHGKRVIDGTPYSWNSKMRRWLREPTGAAEAAQVVQPPVPGGNNGLLLSSIALIDTGPDRNATRRVAFSNTAHVISEALQNLSESFE